MLMNRARLAQQVALIWVISAMACGHQEGPAVITSSGGIFVRALVDPGGVDVIRLSVTGGSIIGTVVANLVQQPDESWSGQVLDLPPGSGLSVSAQAFDQADNVLFAGSVSDVRVYAGAMTDVTLTLAPLAPVIALGVDTPPHVISLQYPESLYYNETANLQATAVDPDPATRLLYTWSVLQGGGTFAPSSTADVTPGLPVATLYTPAAGFRGFAVIQVSASDGMTTTSITFPLAIDPPPMVLFVSSATVAGDTFGGSASAADAFCQTLADAPTAVVPRGIYRALISFDDASASDRLLDTPFIRVDGSSIASGKAQLFGGALDNAIRVNENNVFTGVSAIFTGTNGDGSKGSNCLNWTSADGGEISTAGINATSSSPNWTNSGTFTCAAQLPIYCARQPY
jgi:hypothetical protein